jgi:hypothetical protein
LVVGHSAPTPDPNSRMERPVALPLSMSSAQQSPMFLKPSIPSDDPSAGSALSTNSAHIPNSKRHASGQEQNYLRKRRKQLSVQGQDRDSLDTDNDVSRVDNECDSYQDDFVESVNGPPSPETVSLDLLSTSATHADIGLTRR